MEFFPSKAENSVELEIIYEHDPGYNMAIISDYGIWFILILFLYVGFKAYRDEVIASIHPRDSRSLFDDDFNIHLDTFGDAKTILA